MGRSAESPSSARAFAAPQSRPVKGSNSRLPAINPRWFASTSPGSLGGGTKQFVKQPKKLIPLRLGSMRNKARRKKGIPP